MLRNGAITSYPQINRGIKPNFPLLLHNSSKNKIMKVLQQFPGILLYNVLLDTVNYKCGILEAQFVTGLESKFHIPTPKCESKLFGNRTESVMNFQEM